MIVREATTDPLDYDSKRIEIAISSGKLWRPDPGTRCIRISQRIHLSILISISKPNLIVIII